MAKCLYSGKRVPDNITEYGCPECHAKVQASAGRVIDHEKRRGAHPWVRLNYGKFDPQRKRP